MNPPKPTYEELEVRLAEAEDTLDAIREERIDAVVGKDGVYLLRLKKTEKALDLERARLEAVLHQLPEGVYIAKAPSGELVMGNAQAERIWRYPFFASKTINEYEQYKGFHPDGREYLPHEWPLARTITTGEVVEQEEIQFQRGDGSLGWLSVSSAPIRDERGNVVSGVVTFSDITERKEMEETLRNTRDELEVRIRERTMDLERLTGQLRRLTMQLMVNEGIERDRIARLLHDELQQLLVGAKIQLELISDEVNPGEQEIIEKSVELIGKSIRMSRSLTEELAPQTLAREDLADIVRWLCDFMKKTHHLTVEVSIEDAVRIHNRDVRLFLYQSVRELLFNVVKHAGTNTAQLKLRKSKNDDLEIMVTDKGNGFDSSAVARDNESKFGLFSMRERLSLLGGFLHLESIPGTGTTCTLTLPLMEISSIEDQRRFSSDTRATGAGTTEIRLLVVDDHQVVRDGFAAVFQKEPDITLVGEADTGKKGIEKALALVPDVILMDINMPETNGIEATRTIRASLPEVRIIGLSMDDSQTIKDTMMVAGATDFLSKDSSAKEILATIRNHQG